MVGASALFFGCAKTEPVIVVDDWWNVDFAKNGCERLANVHPCVVDPTVEVRDFEAQLGTSFGADASCHGVILTNYNGPGAKSSDAASKAEWQLMLNYHVGDISQNWSMVGHTNGPNFYTTGQGNPKEIVHDICAVVKQAGGSLR
jgi:hypothetical protein